MAELVARSFEAPVAPWYSREGVETFGVYSKADALKKRTEKDHQTIVAVDDGEIVGMAHTKEGTHIAMLFVSPERQRAGIGRQLLAFILPGCPEPEITLNASPNSVEAYLRLGFEQRSDESQKQGIRFIPMAYNVAHCTGRQAPPAISDHQCG